MVVGLAREFHRNSVWEGADFDEDKVRVLASNLIAGGGVFLNTSGGFIAGTLSPLHFSSSHTIGVELAWYCPNGGGRELREAFEAWAKENGATLVQFSLTPDEKFNQNHDNMTMNGFNIAEIHYVKVL